MLKGDFFISWRLFQNVFRVLCGAKGSCHTGTSSTQNMHSNPSRSLKVCVLCLIAFMALALTSKSLVHFVLTFEQGVKQWFNFFLLQVATQFSKCIA